VERRTVRTERRRHEAGAVRRPTVVAAIRRFDRRQHELTKSSTTLAAVSQDAGKKGHNEDCRAVAIPELLDITEAAEFLCTSIRHMRRLVAEDKLSVVKIGGKLRFDRADLQKSSTTIGGPDARRREDRRGRTAGIPIGVGYNCWRNSSIVNCVSARMLCKVPFATSGRDVPGLSCATVG